MAHDLKLTRTIKAPVGRVWEVLTEGDQIQQWWGPTGFTVPKVEVDLSVGGDRVP